MLAPLYAHCAHCGFPAVVNGSERNLPRRCRQCGERFIPKPADGDGSRRLGPRKFFTAAERRGKLRIRIRQTRRKVI